MQFPVKFILILLTVSNMAYSQHQKLNEDELQYYDENYIRIPKVTHEKRKLEQKLLSVQGDSIHHRILVERESQGKIENRKALDSLLNLASKLDIDSTKPLVIFFYPGKDQCNSSGTATRKDKKNWYDELESGLQKMGLNNILYVYKDSKGLFGRNDGFRNWVKDPDSIVESLFFKRHYPCSSFVVISENGTFISYFGEYPKEYVWRTVSYLSP